MMYGAKMQLNLEGARTIDGESHLYCRLGCGPTLHCDATLRRFCALIGPSFQVRGCQAETEKLGLNRLVPNIAEELHAVRA